MGDSDITLYLSGLALYVMLGAIVAFIIAWRVQKKIVRTAIGGALLVTSVFCIFLSLSAALIVASLGIVVLILARKTPPI